MPRFLERLYRIAVLGGVGCTLVAGPSARAQDAATVQQSLLEAASSTSVPAASGVYGLNHPDTFAAFIQEIGFDDLAARKEAITGEKQFRVDWIAVNHNMIGLSDDEWTTAYAVLLDGSLRLGDWGDQMQEALGWKDGRFQADPTKGATLQLARAESLSRQGDDIVGATIARLRKNLGDQGFNRLASFIDLREGTQTVINRGRIRRGPIQTAKASQTGIPPQK
ncbi:MAG: hypothetical protein WCC27_05485 [Acidobacteriaceae bacterium]